MKITLTGLCVIGVLVLCAALLWLLHEVILIRREVSESQPPRYSAKPIAPPTTSGFQIPPPPF